MRMIRAAVAAIALTALLCGPAAAKNYAPPGRAGTSQYAEDIPSAGGNVSTPAMGGGNKTAAQIDHTGAGKQGVRRLTALGKSGVQAAQFAQATAPPTAPAPNRGSTSGPQTTTRTQRTAPLRASGGSALSGLGHLIGGSDTGGIGAFLPVLLALSLAAILLAVRLRRPRADDARP